MYYFKNKFQRVFQKTVLRITKWVSVVLTWITFVLFFPSIVFATYHLFWDFDAKKVLAASAVLAVSVLLNKSL